MQRQCKLRGIRAIKNYSLKVVLEVESNRCHERPQQCGGEDALFTRAGNRQGLSPSLVSEDHGRA